VRVGELVRESESDPEWVLYDGTLGLILRSADEDMGLENVVDTPFYWWVSWGNGATDMMSVNDIEVVNASR